MKNKNFLKKLTAGILGFVMTLGVGAAGYSASAIDTKAVEGDTHDYSYNISKLLNNGAVPDSISITNPGFSISKITISGTYNKTNKISASATIGGVSAGSTDNIGGSSNWSADISPSNAMSGDVNITFSSKLSGTGKGTLNITKVTLTEGAAGTSGDDSGDDSGGGLDIDEPYYVIGFKCGSGDGSSVSTSTTVSTVLSEGLDYVTGNFTAATQSYCGGLNGLKLGKSGGAGSLSFNLSNAGKVKAKQIVAYAKRYNAGKTAKLKINNSAEQSLTADFDYYYFDIDSSSKLQSIQLDSTNYSWVQYIAVVYEEEGAVPVTGVTISPKTASLKPGGTEQLTATVAPSDAADKEVSWTSSNNSVATVSNTGLVTAIAAGSATITVTTHDGSKTDTCAVTVSNVAVTGVSLNKTSTSIYVGASETLTATVSPNDAADRSVGWSSSDESVATVSNGTITALKAGSTIITVTTTDGGFTATCSVTVNNVAVTGVSVSPTSKNAYVGTEETLVATVSPANATNKNVAWESSDDSKATVDENGKVSILSEGTVTITVKTEDGNYSASCVLTITEKTGIIKNGNYVISHTRDSVTYYLKSNGTESAPSAVTDASNATIFTFTLVPSASTDNTYTIKTSDGDFLYSTTSNNGVRVGSNDFKWIIETGQSTLSGAYNIKQTTALGNGETARFLTLYDKSDFRTYNSATAGNRGENTDLTKICNHTASDAWTTDGTQHWKVCSECGEEIANSRTNHTADLTKWESDENGHWRVCGVCGAKIDSTYAAHSGGTPTVEHGAYCEVCSHEYGPKHTHTADTSHWETDGTYHWRVCSDCGDVIEETKVAHTPDSVWHSDATGHWHICSVCGIKLESTFASHSGGEATEEHGAYCECCGYEYTSALPHEHSHDGSWVSDDTNHWHVCQKCSEIIEDTVAAHTYGDWVIDSDSTFEETGSKHRDCSVCGHRETNTIPCKEHNFSSEWTDTGASGHAHYCTDSGYTSLYKDLTAHTYGDWTIDTDATYSAAGSKHRDCSVCGHRETEEIPMLVHHYSESWTSAGAEGHWHVCTDAGYGNLHSPETPVAHNMVKIDHQDATADDEGYDLFECSDCGYQNTVIIPPSATYTMTIDSGTKGNNNVHWTSSSVEKLVYDGVTWNTSVSGTTSFTASNSYAQIGSKSNPATKVSLSSSAFGGKTISSLSLTGYCMSNEGPALTVYAGGVEFISSTPLVKGTSTTYSVSSDFEPVKLGNTDTLVFEINSSASAAICISEISITYQGGAKIPVESVTLDSSEETIAKGSNLTLSATVLPENASNKHVEWTSSDETVATVDGGIVTALDAGTATITATANNGVYSSCIIHVYDPEVFTPKYTSDSYNFKEKFNDFNSGWSSAYSNTATIDRTNATIELNKFSKQTSTITDMPVAKDGGAYIEIIAKQGKVISSAEAQFRQWTTKAKEITIYSSTDGGLTYTAISTSDTFYIDCLELPANTNAVKIEADSGSNQVALLGLSYNLEDKATTYIWKNYDGTQLYSTTATGSNVPSYGGSTPVKPSTSSSEFIFNGWSNAVEDASGNLVFTAQFKEVPIHQYIAIDDQTAFLEFQEANHFEVEGLPADGKLSADMEFDLNTTNGRVFDLESIYFFIETVGDCTVKYSSDGETWHVLDNSHTPTTRAIKKNALPEDATYLSVHVNEEAKVKGMSIKTRLPIDGASSEAYITWNWEETAPGVADVSIAKTGIKFTFTFNQLGFADYLGENNDVYSAKFVYGYSTDEMTYEELMDYDGKKISADTLTTIKHEGEASFTVGLSKATSWQRVYTCALVIFDSNGNVVDHSEVLCASFEDVFYEYYDSTDMSQKYEEQALDIILGQLI